MINPSDQQTVPPEEQSSWITLSSDGDNSSNNNNDKSSSSTTSSSSNSHSSEEKYGLRPRNIIKRLQQERGLQQVTKGSRSLTRPKARPAPLSKYRRKTANARERHRMREINNAFESLRRVLPEALEVEAASSSMTKITTLRLAADYIKTLSGVLQDESGATLRSLQCDATGPLLRASPAPPHQHHHLLGYFSPASHGATSTSRDSLSSSSDLEDLLSDDSSLLDDSFSVFHDIPSLPGGDPLDLLLEADKGLFPLPLELCN